MENDFDSMPKGIQLRLIGDRKEILKFFETYVPIFEEHYEAKIFPEEPKPERGKDGLYRSYLRIPLEDEED